MTLGRYVLIVGAALSWVSIPGAHQSILGLKEDAFIISTGRAGPIEVGMTVDEIYGVVGRNQTRLVDLFLEGMFEPALEVRIRGGAIEPALIVSINQWPCPSFSARGIRVLDPRFRTKEGVGVGSTLRELRRHYKIQLTDAEGPHAVVESERITFGLRDASRSDVVRVESVWLPGNPVEIRARRCPNVPRQ